MTDDSRPEPNAPSGSDPASPDRSPESSLSVEEGVPDFVAARDHVRESLVRFARSLRRAGVSVPANAATEAARALVRTGFERSRARAALRATLVTRREDLDAFERQFPEFWRRLTAGLDGEGPAQRLDDVDGGLAPLGADAGADGSDPGGSSEEAGDSEATATTAWVGGTNGDGEGGDRLTASVYSETGSPTPVSMPPTLREDGLAGPVERLTRSIAGLAGRRWESGDPRGTVDARRALRESFSTGGSVVSVPGKDHKQTAVRATLLVDVSQSVLDTVDRGFLLAFLHRVVASWRSVRVFFFDEGLREVTDAFDRPTTAGAVQALERAQAEWGGGTRIGDAFETLRERHPGAVDRRTVTLVVSDGLETGDVDRLADGTAWLSRRARTLLWCNPLAASPEYEPACRGMDAALPYLDGLFALAGPEDVAEMARQLRLRGTSGPIGYEHDFRRRDGGARQKS